MALTKQKKEEILKELKDWVKKSKVVIFVNFHGLSNVLVQELRRLIKQADARYLVAKKTLIKKALDEFKFSGNLPDFEGEVALVFGEEDQVAPAKTLQKFSKEHEEIKFLGGILDGSFLEKESIVRLATLPSKEVLIARFLNVINSPRSGLVGVLSGVQRNLLNVLNQIKK